MNRTIFCKKLGQQAEALSEAPYPGELGKRINHEISQAAWQSWLNHQTMLINEYRLSPIEPKSRAFLEQEMIKFLFGDGSEKPTDFIAE